ncbi:hypothetical protein ACQY0O_005437 [Thecaphora frezii]
MPTLRLIPQRRARPDVDELGAQPNHLSFGPSAFAHHGSSWSFCDSLNVHVKRDGDPTADTTNNPSDAFAVELSAQGVELKRAIHGAVSPQQAGPELDLAVGGSGDRVAEAQRTATTDEADVGSLSDPDDSGIPSDCIADAAQLQEALGRARSVSGVGKRCKLTMRLRSGVAWIWLQNDYRIIAPDAMDRIPYTITLAITFLSQGDWHTISMTAPGPRAYNTPQSERQKANPAKWHWSFRDLSTSMQRLIREASADEVPILLAVTGHLEPRYMQPLLSLQPSPVSQERLLSTIANLLKADESEFVRLKPMLHNDDSRTIKAHKRILAKYSSYFTTMFSSGFAEGQRQRPRDRPGTEKLSRKSSASEEVEEANGITASINALLKCSKSQNDATHPHPWRASASLSAQTPRTDVNSPCSKLPGEQPQDDATLSDDPDGRRAPSLPLGLDDGESDSVAASKPSWTGIKKQRVLDAVGQHEDAEADGAWTGAADDLPIIELHDLDYETLESLVFYFYTRTCCFRSRKARQPRILATKLYPSGPRLATSPWTDGTLECCDAEQMYRVADMHGDSYLKRLAREHIVSELSTETAFQALFSNELATVYEEIREIYIDFCVENFDEIARLDSYSQTVTELVSGKYPASAANALKTVMSRIRAK